MFRYFIFLSYKGTAYHGWQIQPNGISVQETIERAISTILRSSINIVGAGRTDAGVHAKLMVAHFDTENAILDTNTFTFKLNNFLPQDIAIQKIIHVKDNAHARFDAISRTYEYWLTIEKNPFLTEYAARIAYPLNFEAMNQAAQMLLSYTDFTSFSKLHTDVKTNNCRIRHANWQQNGEIWIFTIQADRFLRNMVRAIVGTLLCVGRSQLSKSDFQHIIEAKDRNKAGTSAPAQGLYLTDIQYPNDIFNIKEV